MPWRAWLPKRNCPTVAVDLATGGARSCRHRGGARREGAAWPPAAAHHLLPGPDRRGGVGRLPGRDQLLALGTLAAIALLLPRGTSLPWTVGAFWIAGGLVVAVAAALSDNARQLRQRQANLADTQARLQTVVGELAHRNRNSLYVIMSIVSQSARGAASAAEAEQVINARLAALLRAQDVIDQSDGGVAHLRPLMERLLSPSVADRIEIAASPAWRSSPIWPSGWGWCSMSWRQRGRMRRAVETGWARGWSPGRAPRTDSAHLARGRRPRRRQPFEARLWLTAIRRRACPQGGSVERRFEPDGLVCELGIPAPPDPSRARVVDPARLGARGEHRQRPRRRVRRWRPAASRRRANPLHAAGFARWRSTNASFRVVQGRWP